MLVAFEGIDGTGKSTQIRLLAESLCDMGHTVQLTREPTDGPVGQRIRELYASRAEVSKEEELELFIDDRRQHVAEIIQPALAAGTRRALHRRSPRKPPDRRRRPARALSRSCRPL